MLLLRKLTIPPHGPSFYGLISKNCLSMPATYVEALDKVCLGQLLEKSWAIGWSHVFDCLPQWVMITCGETWSFLGPCILHNIFLTMNNSPFVFSFAFLGINFRISHFAPSAILPTLFFFFSFFLWKVPSASNPICYSLHHRTSFHNHQSLTFSNFDPFPNLNCLCSFTHTPGLIILGTQQRSIFLPKHPHFMPLWISKFEQC